MILATCIDSTFSVACFDPSNYKATRFFGFESKESEPNNFVTGFVLSWDTAHESDLVKSSLYRF